MYINYPYTLWDHLDHWKEVESAIFCFVVWNVPGISLHSSFAFVQRHVVNGCFQMMIIIVWQAALTVLVSMSWCVTDHVCFVCHPTRLTGHNFGFRGNKEVKWQIVILFWLMFKWRAVICCCFVRGRGWGSRKETLIIDGDHYKKQPPIFMGCGFFFYTHAHVWVFVLNKRNNQLFDRTEISSVVNLWLL